MRLISRNRQRHSPKGPRISISQAEITADLNYPAQRRETPTDSARALRTR